MKKQHTKRQHYVPRFLLKSFSFDGDCAWVLDRMQSNKTYKTRIDSICYENDIYDEKWKDAAEQLGKYVLDNQIEDYFAELENMTAPLIYRMLHDINNLTRKYLISDTEKQLLAELVATLYLRNPYIFRRIIAAYEGVEKEEEVNELIQETDAMFDIMLFGSAVSLIEFSKKAMIFSREIDNSPVNEEIRSILKRRYVFWYSENGGFVTTSFPLAIFDVDIEKRIVFPISPDLAIVFYENSNNQFAEGSVIHINEEELNAGMRAYSHALPLETFRFIISKDDDTLTQLFK